ncbi:DUF4105 domain-containing protein [Silvanigrella paludirubra]|uniref:DUF4105 domain-containing protein n=1 Tax=Silvanigrella paludirubra TaxID=2499159 RepID=A0A6N6VSC6_9BACT|nr:DUF4105 domain-containing protein [Silvanigrella paludirubra]KAB8038848.1 DUF4105 domain-containing protein [Silvanigrella paludirubra]
MIIKNIINYFLYIILFFNCIFQSKKLYGESLSYIDNLIFEAQSKKLWDKRAWIKLLLIPDHFFYNNKRSLISDKSYFLALDGKYNPENELISTLKAFNEPLVINSSMHPQCKYAARFYWLVKELKIDPSKMTFQSCPEYNKFINYLNYEDVSLVFSNYVADGPGTLFGHTFLRLHRNSYSNGDSVLQDDIVNFSAFVPQEKEFLYPIKGLAGGYKGRFSLVPYYQKIQEYNNYESRDLWEYRLNLSKDEIRLLERVLWEVGWFYIDYYYLDHNCAYIMLSILEAVKPDLELTGKLWLYAIPSDTIRIVNRVPKFIKSIHYRPSVLSRYKERMSVLNQNETKIVSNIISNDETVLIKSLSNECDKYCKARTIDSALEYIDYKEKLVGSNNPIEFQNLRNQLLIARSQDGVKSDPLLYSPKSNAPHLGHDSGLVSLNLGSSINGDIYSDLRWRPALHDIEANEQGYSNGLGVGFLDTILRVDYKNKQINLKNFHLLEITSLPEQVPNIQFLAWHFDIGYEYGFGFGDASTQGREYLKMGFGSALFGFENKALLFAIIQGDFGYSSDFGAHIGPTLSIGGLAKLSPYFKLILQSDFSKRYNYERNIDSMEHSLILNYYIAQNFETQIGYVNKNGTNEISLGLRIYY